MPLLKANNIFLSNSFFIFISRFFPSLANLLVMIWFSRHLPEATYGNYQIFWVQLYIIYPFMCFGIHTLIVTYSREMLANILSRITNKQYAIFSGWLILFGSLFAWLQSNSSGVSFYTSFFFILTFSLGIIIESLLIVFRKYYIVSITGFLYALAFCFLHWYVLKNNYSINTIFSFLLIFNLLKVFIYSIAVLMEVKKDATGYEHEEIDMGAIRSLWLHLGIYDIIQMLSTWIDKFAISIILTAELSAIYYNGAQNIPFLPILLAAAGSAVLLQLSDANYWNEREYSLDLLHQTGRILSSIVFPVFFFLFIFRSELIVTLLSEKYIPAIPVFAVSVLVLPVRAYSFTTMLQRHHKGNIINIGATAELILACALMYPLYLLMGLPGVALSFVISTYLQAAYYLVYTGKLLEVSPLSLIPLRNWLIKLSAFAILFMAIHYIGYLYFTSKFTLILGSIATVLFVILSLLIEIYIQKKRTANHNQTITI